MSIFKVNIIAVNPLDESQQTVPLESLVDTGSELTWLPAGVLKQAGIKPKKELSFKTATGEIVKRSVGYAILRAEGFETNDEVVFANPGDSTLLGVRTIEGFGVMVDNIAHSFIARATIVA
jgi:predicted aspartyl protease